MTEVSFQLDKKGFKRAVATFLTVILVVTLVPIMTYTVLGSVLNGTIPDMGCVTDGNADAKKELVTTGNGGYFHEYKEPTFEWSADGTSCTATFVCEKGDDTLVVNCKVISKVTATATETKDGKISNTASVTVYQKIYSATKEIKIPKASKAELSKTMYTYNGKLRLPKITVKDSKGELIDASNYTVSYNDNKNVGTGTVTVAFDGKRYSGTITKNFKVVPKATTIKSIVADKQSIKVTWSKKTTQVTGYQIAYSTSSKFTSEKTKTVLVNKNTTTSKTIKGLAAKKNYYVRVRTYTLVDGKKCYSEWSDSVLVKTK